MLPPKMERIYPRGNLYDSVFASLVHRREHRRIEGLDVALPKFTCGLLVDFSTRVVILKERFIISRESWPLHCSKSGSTRHEQYCWNFHLERAWKERIQT